MNSKKRASLGNNSPLDQLFSPSSPRQEERQPPREETGPEPPPAGPEAPASRPEPGEVSASPEEAAPSLRQTTIMIYEDQSDWLDEACYRAKRESGSIVSKAAIIRALVDLARAYDVSFAGVQADDEILARLMESFRLR